MNYWFLYLLTTGEIYASPYLGNASEWTNIPAGCAVLGPFDSATASAIVKDAYAHPNYYLVQSGSLVTVANLTQLQLQDAQNSKIASLEASCQQTLDAGFTSSANGTAIVYGFKDVDQTNLSQEYLTAGLETFPISWSAKDGTLISLTQPQFTQLIKDSKAFKWTQVGKLRNLIGRVQTVQVTTPNAVAIVNAIVW